ncbi:MAG TPA: glycosyltransferase family 4 protein [Steroidobacteraceae bacterium]|jgi:glycosyltransferase involved in cell wall biosynthesis|nr:glycosyltransferase family 4 protein [Steroidobacteraceae bacterium]
MSVRCLQFVIPGDLRAPTGGYVYDRRMLAGLRELGWQVRVHTLDASFPHPTAVALERARQVFSSLPDQALVLIDGLALGAMPDIVQPHARRLRLVALIHHPLAAENGLAPYQALELVRSERVALQAVRHVLVTSHATQRALLAYGVDAGRVSVVQPGVDAAPLAPRQRGAVLNLLCVATLTPRKGHDLLFEALASLPPRWHLICIGSLTRSATTVAALRRQLRQLNLDRQVVLEGEVDDATLAQRYAQADLFVLPTRFEGYGMVIAEALAHGLPVISTRVGAIPQLVGSQAGLLVDAGDVGMLRAALARVVSETGLLSSLARGAEAVRGDLPRWPDSCALMSRVLQNAADQGGG